MRVEVAYPGRIEVFDTDRFTEAQPFAGKSLSLIHILCGFPSSSFLLLSFPPMILENKNVLNLS